MHTESKGYPLLAVHGQYQYPSAETKEPLKQHEFAPRSWSRVAANLCELDVGTRTTGGL